MSGARVQWLKTPEAGDAANISFPSDGLAPTTTRGFSQTTGTLTSRGTIGFAPALLDAGVRSTAGAAPAGALLAATAGDSPETASADAFLPTPAPPLLAYIGISLGSIDPWSGTMELTMGKPERAESLAVQPERIRRGGEDSSREPEALWAGGAVARPAPARLSSSRRRFAALEAPSCAAPSFRALSVNGAVQGPFTLTVTDLTPKTGESSGTEEVGSGFRAELPEGDLPRVQVADVGAGLLAVSSTLAATLLKARTGRGVHVEQPLVTGELAGIPEHAGDGLDTGRRAPMRRGASRRSSPRAPAPALGADTGRVLHELGFTADEIAAVAG
jgi:hypothetical protein